MSYEHRPVVRDYRARYFEAEGALRTRERAHAALLVEHQAAVRKGQGAALEIELMQSEAAVRGALSAALEAYREFWRELRDEMGSQAAAAALTLREYERISERAGEPVSAYFESEGASVPSYGMPLKPPSSRFVDGS